MPLFMNNEWRSIPQDHEEIDEEEGANEVADVADNEVVEGRDPTNSSTSQTVGHRTNVAGEQFRAS